MTCPAVASFCLSINRMDSTRSTAEKTPDDLLNPRSKKAVRIDERLLDQRVWCKHPKLVCDLLTELAAQGGGKGLSALAASYLAATSNLFQPETCPPKGIDYFLVLGNALKTDATPTPELTARLEGALWASEKNPAARLLVSGGAQVRDIKECEVMSRWLIDRGVCPRRVLQERRSLDTVENIRMSTRLLTQQNARNVCLISGGEAARRGAVLLSSHLQHIESAIKAVYLMPLTPEAKHIFADMPAVEKFLLFKDMGRIFGLWIYRKQYRRQHRSAA